MLVIPTLQVVLSAPLSQFSSVAPSSPTSSSSSRISSVQKHQIPFIVSEFAALPQSVYAAVLDPSRLFLSLLHTRGDVPKHTQKSLLVSA